MTSRHSAHLARPCSRLAATEHRLLASLWLLESMESVWRSPATVCLNDYLKHLAVISPEVGDAAPGVSQPHLVDAEHLLPSTALHRPASSACARPPSTDS